MEALDEARSAVIGPTSSVGYDASPVTASRGREATRRRYDTGICSCSTHHQTERVRLELGHSRPSSPSTRRVE